MNWVGGWRSRVMKSNDMRKQKEFFEKKRMQNRHHLLPPSPATPTKGNAANMDLLTMFIVNQIALKKEHTGKPHITRLPPSKGIHQCVGGESLELPMSPCSPSHLSLTECKSHLRDKTLKKKNQRLPDEFKFKTLSDNSTSVYQHRVQGSVGSFSSASQSSSEGFNFQPRSTVHISSPPSTKSDCKKTAQPPGVCDNSGTVPFQTMASQTGFADGIQFGNTLHREKSEPSIHSAENPFNDFEMNDQGENTHFSGLNKEDISGVRTTKLHLQEETPYPSTVSHDFSEVNNKDHSIDFLSQHVSRCVDCRPSRVHRIISEHACESPVTCSQREGCVFSDDVTNSAPSLRYILGEGKRQYGDSYMRVCNSKDILATVQNCPSGMSAPTRVMSFKQKMMHNCKHRGTESKAHGISKSIRQIGHEQDCKGDQFVPSYLQNNNQIGKMHKKASCSTQDKATQTAGFSSLNSQDASVQCCLLKASRMSVFTEPTTHLHHNKTHRAPATRRQTHHSRKKHDSSQSALSEIHKVEWKTSWMTSKREPTKQSPETIKGHEDLSKSESLACMKKHPLLQCSHTNPPELKQQSSENLLRREEKCEGHVEESMNQNPTVNSSCTEEHGNAFATETSGDGVSEGKGDLKEIANILLMLKEKNKHP